VQRLVPAARRREHNDVAGFIYAVVGVIYAVLLALMVIAVWEEHEAAKATVREEANELADVFWLAHRLPEPEGPRLQGLALSYARVVVEEEWPLMARGGNSSPEAWALVDEMRLGMQNVEVDTRSEQVLFERGLEHVDAVADARRERMVEAEEGIPAVLWAVLVFGGYHHRGLHLPVRAGEHVVAQAHGGGGGGADRPGALHRGQPGVPLLGRNPGRPRSLRARSRRFEASDLDTPDKHRRVQESPLPSLHPAHGSHEPRFRLT
jgi:hypothetical protein